MQISGIFDLQRDECMRPRELCEVQACLQQYGKPLSKFGMQEPPPAVDDDGGPHWGINISKALALLDVHTGRNANPVSLSAGSFL